MFPQWDGVFGFWWILIIIIIIVLLFMFPLNAAKA